MSPSPIEFTLILTLLDRSQGLKTEDLVPGIPTPLGNSPLPVDQPLERPKHLPPSVLWTWDDCKADPTVIRSGNNSRPSLMHLLRNADGSITPSAIYTGIRALAQTQASIFTAGLPAGTDHRKRSLTPRFDAALLLHYAILENQCPQLALCANHYKAKQFIFQCIRDMDLHKEKGKAKTPIVVPSSSDEGANEGDDDADGDTDDEDTTIASPPAPPPVHQNPSRKDKGKGKGVGKVPKTTATVSTKATRRRKTKKTPAPSITPPTTASSADPPSAPALTTATTPSPVLATTTPPPNLFAPTAPSPDPLAAAPSPDPLTTIVSATAAPATTVPATAVPATTALATTAPATPVLATSEPATAAPAVATPDTTASATIAPTAATPVSPAMSTPPIAVITPPSATPTPLTLLPTTPEVAELEDVDMIVDPSDDEMARSTSTAEDGTSKKRTREQSENPAGSAKKTRLDAPLANTSSLVAPTSRKYDLSLVGADESIDDISSTLLLLHCPPF